MKNIVLIITNIILIISVIFLCIIINISTFFSAKNMSENLKKINMHNEIKKIKNTSSNPKEQEISEIINEAYNQAQSHNISKKLIDEIFNSKQIKSFIGLSIGSKTDYIINNKKIKEPTEKDLNKIIEQNIDIWIKNSNTKISESKKEVLIIRLKNASKSIIKSLPSNQIVSQKLNKRTQQKIHIIFSQKTKTILLLLIIILLTAIYKLQKEKIKTLFIISISFLISGLSIIGLSFLCDDIIIELISKYNLSFLLRDINVILNHNIFISGITITITSIILLIIYSKHKIIN